MIAELLGMNYGGIQKVGEELQGKINVQYIAQYV
jgi:hypothetical protein